MIETFAHIMLVAFWASLIAHLIHHTLRASLGLFTRDYAQSYVCLIVLGNALYSFGLM